MNAAEARQILLRYRPGTADEQEPEVAQALQLVRQDAELERWFKAHCEFQRAMQAKFRQLEAPSALRAKILAAERRARSAQPAVRWRQPAWLAAAAAVLVLAGLSAFWLWPRNASLFADFQARMASVVLREYRMDLRTHDKLQLRQFLAAQGAPSDYSLTKGLQQLELTGGGQLRWHNQPVAMVCFNRGDQQMLFLFVLNRAAIKDPPPVTPRVGKVNKLETASWTEGDKAYFLAGPEGSALETKILR